MHFLSNDNLLSIINYPKSNPLEVLSETSFFQSVLQILMLNVVVVSLLMRDTKLAIQKHAR